jgi:hypothetical protein
MPRAGIVWRSGDGKNQNDRKGQTMNWLGMITGAVAGGLAAWVSQLIMRKLGRQIAVVRYLVFAVVFGLALFVSREYVQPQVVATQMETELLKLPVYQALQEHEPAVYAQIAQAMRIAVANKTPNEVIWAQTRPLISGVIGRRAKTASDDAVRQLASVVVDEVSKLHARGDTTCYEMLFPQARPPIDMLALLGEEAAQLELAAQTAIIGSSATAPQPTPTEADIAESLQNVVAALQTKYTDADIAALQNPGAAGVNKRKVCEMSADLYREVLKLPAQDSGKVLRFMMSGQ